MGRARNGQAIRLSRLAPNEVDQVRELLREGVALKDLSLWRRAKAVLGYIEGRSAIAMAAELDADRSPVTKWVSWYDKEGSEGLRTRPRLGRAPRLSDEQRAEVVQVVEAGPQAAGFRSGVWTGALVGKWIEQR
jgi:transposase